MVIRVNSKKASIKELVESLSKVSPIDIVIFLTTTKGKATWSDLEKHFVKGDMVEHISTQTLSNYLKMLIRAGLVKKEIDAETLQPIYTLGQKESEINYLISVRRLEKEIVKLLGDKEHETEFKKWADFEAACRWLKEFELDLTDFRTALLVLALKDEITDEEIKILLEWCRKRLIKEHSEALKSAKNMYSAAKIKVVAIWPKQQIDLGQEILEAHEKMLKTAEYFENLLENLLKVESNEERKNILRKEIMQFNFDEYLKELKKELKKIST